MLKKYEDFSYTHNMNHALTFDNQALKNLQAQLTKLRELNQLFAQYLPLEMVKHCQVVKLENHHLTVIVDNGHWATQLRFHTPDLLEHLRKHRELASLIAITCKTRPSLTLPRLNQADPVRTVARLAPETAAELLVMAETIEDNRIRESLIRIAGYSTRSRAT